MLFGLYRLRLSLDSLTRPWVWRLDFIQTYILARATAERQDPTLPVNILAARYIPDLAVPAYSHATPHPQTVGLLFLPLAALDYQAAAIAWFCFSLITLYLAVVLLTQMNGFRHPCWLAFPASVVALGLPVVPDNLVQGQSTLPILLLVVLAWVALQSDRPVLAGIGLGLTLLIKPFTWPLVIFLLFQRRWRSLASCIATALAGAGFALVWNGPEALLRYAAVLPNVSAIYRSSLTNTSVWSLPYDRTSVATQFDRLGQVQVFLSATLALGVLALACLALSRGMERDGAFCLMACLSTVINPISWACYGVLNLLALVYVVRWLAARRFPRFETNVAAVILVVVMSPIVFPLSQLQGIYTVVYTLATLALGGLVVYLDRRREAPIYGG